MDNESANFPYKKFSMDASQNNNFTMGDAGAGGSDSDSDDNISVMQRPLLLGPTPDILVT